MSAPSPQASVPKTTKGFIRAFGAIMLLGGGLVIYFGGNWYVDGLIPMRWFGACFAAFGAWMEIHPERFLERASRFEQIGDQLSGKNPSKLS
jgi:hypothetical protein